MDANNERLVFDLIVETATEKSSQYFLFSPKLLMGMNLTENMTVHLISNGPKVDVTWRESVQSPRQS